MTSGGKFTKIYTVADDAYYGMQSKIHTLVRELGNTQNNAIEKYFDEYAMKHFKITPDAKISYIPFLLSES